MGEKVKGSASVCGSCCHVSPKFLCREGKFQRGAHGEISKTGSLREREHQRMQFVEHKLHFPIKTNDQTQESNSRNFLWLFDLLCSLLRKCCCLCGKTLGQGWPSSTRERHKESQTQTGLSKGTRTDSLWACPVFGAEFCVLTRQLGSDIEEIQN